MVDKAVALTGKQKNKLLKSLARPFLAPNFAETGQINPNLRVFVVHFDGTNNDKDAKLDDDEKQTLVASLFDEIENGPLLQKKYYPGVGTMPKGSNSNYVRSFFESVSGFGCAGKAERAYIDLIAQAEQWRLDSPNDPVQVHVHVVGFSRGAATALHFMNLIDVRGIKSPKQTAGIVDLPTDDQVEAFQPGSVKTSAVLFDVVSTGQDQTLMLQVPNTAVSILHLVAESENRIGFELTPIALKKNGAIETLETSLVKGVKSPYSNSQFGEDGSFLYTCLNQISLPGVHADIGGSYKNGGIDKVAMFHARAYQRSLGMPGPDPLKPHFSEIQNAYAHDSQWSVLKMLDDIVGSILDVPSNGNSSQFMNRTAKKVLSPEWNGDLIQTASLTLKEGSLALDNVKIRFPIALRPGQGLQSENDCGRRYNLIFSPLSTMHPLEFKTNSGLFKLKETLDGTRLFFKDRAIDDSKGVGSLFKRLMEKDSNLSLDVDVSYQKQIILITDYMQDIPLKSTQSLDKRIFSQDPWPKSICDTIKMLYGYSERKIQKRYLNRVDALSLMSRCIREASDTLKTEFPETNRIQIKHRKHAGNFTVGFGADFAHDSLDVFCSGVPGHLGNEPDLKGLNVLFTSKSKSSTPEQYALQSRMRDMSDALNAVRIEFNKVGFDVSSVCNIDIDLTKSTSIKTSKDVKYSDSPEIVDSMYHIPISSSRMRMH